jgi:hypothetical protein
MKREPTGHSSVHPFTGTVAACIGLRSTTRIGLIATGLLAIGSSAGLGIGCQGHPPAPGADRAEDSGGTAQHARALTDDPSFWESGWSVSQRVPLTAAHGAHFSPVDGRLYMGRRLTGNDGGVYRVLGLDTAAKVASGDRVAGVEVAADGAILFSEDFAGRIVRHGSVQGTQTWVSGFHSGDDDPVGIAIAPDNYTGAVLSPGQALVVDRGYNGLDEVWRFSTSSAQGAVRVHADNGVLVDAVDVAINSTTVLIADRGSEAVDGHLYILDSGGGLTELATSIAFPSPEGIAVDPRTDEFVVADSVLSAIYRLDGSGNASKIIDNVEIFGWAGIDFNDDGSQLAVTSVDEVIVLSNCDATLFPGNDCDSNGVTDICDIAAGVIDCDDDRIPDACELAADPGLDCNNDGVLDECPACGDMDIIFIMDTSASMEDEGTLLCHQLDALIVELAAAGLNLNVSLLGIDSTGSSVFSCLTGTVVGAYGTTVPGNPPAGNEILAACPGGNEVGSEDWGRAVSVTAANHAWATGAVRVIVPLFDEGPWCGNPVTDPGVDRDSIDHAITIASQHDVIVSPVTGSGSSASVINMATDLAVPTGGEVHSSSNSATELFEGLTNAITSACEQIYDCDDDGQPDSCQLDAGTATDCDENGRLDSCDLAEGKDPGTC